LQDAHINGDASPTSSHTHTNCLPMSLQQIL
jgi:hypothetical protein